MAFVKREEDVETRRLSLIMEHKCPNEGKDGVVINLNDSVMTGDINLNSPEPKPEPEPDKNAITDNLDYQWRLMGGDGPEAQRKAKKESR